MFFYILHHITAQHKYRIMWDNFIHAFPVKPGNTVSCPFITTRVKAPNYLTYLGYHGKDFKIEIY